jgi:hypothetical protein
VPDVRQGQRASQRPGETTETSVALLGRGATRQNVRVSASFNPEDGQRYLVELAIKEVVLVSYAPKLAAALSGATIRQLAYWRKPGP